MRKATYPSETDIRDRLTALSRQLEPWSIPATALDRVHDAARASLAEVQALIAYQDGKASRLLTNVTFLSALVSAVFTRFASNFGWPGGGMQMRIAYLLPAATSASFLLYVMLVTVAVLMILDAIRPSFTPPLTWTGAPQPDRPGSMLFFERMLDVEAPVWARTFIEAAGADGHDLKALYAKSYIAESYAVAEKVAVKIARLDRGIVVLRTALFCLVIFLVLFSVTTVAIGPVPLSP